MPITSNHRSTRRNAVMLVEHNAFTRRLIGSLLAQAGIDKVVVAENAAMADLMLKTNPVDAILLDWPASGTESGRLLARLRQADNPQTAMTPVIITSTHVDLDLLERAAALNASSVLLKPFSQGVLRSHLTAALGTLDVADPDGADVEAGPPTEPVPDTAHAYAPAPPSQPDDSEIYYL